jgi:hypothetical protein
LWATAIEALLGVPCIVHTTSLTPSYIPIPLDVLSIIPIVTIIHTTSSTPSYIPIPVAFIGLHLLVPPAIPISKVVPIVAEVIVALIIAEVEVGLIVAEVIVALIIAEVEVGLIVAEVEAWFSALTNIRSSTISCTRQRIREKLVHLLQSQLHLRIGTPTLAPLLAVSLWKGVSALIVGPGTIVNVQAVFGSTLVIGQGWNGSVKIDAFMRSAAIPVYVVVMWVVVA